MVVAGELWSKAKIGPNACVIQLEPKMAFTFLNDWEKKLKRIFYNTQKLHEV